MPTQIWITDSSPSLFFNFGGSNLNRQEVCSATQLEFIKFSFRDQIFCIFNPRNKKLSISFVASILYLSGYFLKNFILLQIFLFWLPYVRNISRKMHNKYRLARISHKRFDLNNLASTFCCQINDFFIYVKM